MTARIGFLLALILLQLLPSPAAGQAPQCGTRQRVLDRLANAYKEEPVAIGVTSTGSLLEVLASPDGSSWTIIITIPGGPTCLVSSGEGWRGAPVTIHDPRA